MATPASTPTATLIDKAVLISVNLRKWGNSKKLTGNPAVQVRDADETLIRITKRLVESPELEAINTLDNEIRQHIYKIALPGFFDGVYFVGKEILVELDAKLREYRENRNILVTLAAEALEVRIAETLERLGAAGNPGDYPTPEAFTEAFTMEWGYLELKVPESLKAINPAIYAEETVKAENRMMNATTQIRALLRTTFGEHVAKFIDRLEGKRENGKIKLFRDSMIENLRTFLGSFDARNLTDDAGLAELVIEARDAVDGLTGDDLRGLDEIRENTLAAFRELDEKFKALEN